LNFGTGAVGLAVPDDSRLAAAIAAPELLHYPIDDLPTRYQVLVIGPGLGVERVDLAGKLISTWSGPIVVDADALKVIEPDRPLTNRSVVITPHAGEFERMTGQAPSYQTARQLASAIGGTVLLKGNPTFVTNGGAPWVVNVGGPELATIGTGDVLSGMIASLLALGLSPIDAARSGAYWHGRAGAEVAAAGTLTAARLAEHLAELR
jgi:NAD(P)H-hydrate epimerase